MARIYIKEFRSAPECQDFVQDIIVGSIPLGREALDLKGKTLTFTTPAVTVTFTGTKMYPKDIVEQINTQCNAQVARARNYMRGDGQDIRIALVRDNDVLTGGTAAALLGLTAGTVGANKLAGSAIISLGNKGSTGDTLVLAYEV